MNEEMRKRMEKVEQLAKEGLQYRQIMPNMRHGCAVEKGRI